MKSRAVYLLTAALFCSFFHPITAQSATPEATVKDLYLLEYLKLKDRIAATEPLQADSALLLAEKQVALALEHLDSSYMMQAIWKRKNLHKLKKDTESQLKDLWLLQLSFARFMPNNLKAQLAFELGGALYDMQEYQTCYQYFENAASFYQLENNALHVAQSYMGMGNSQYMQDHYEQAITLYQKAKEQYQQAKAKNGEAYVHGSLGNIYDAQTHFEQAFTHYQTAYDLYDQLDHTYGKAWMQNNMAATLTHLNLHAQAINALKDGRKLATKANAPEWLLFNYETSSLLFEKINNHQLALFYHKEWVKLKDSLSHQAKEIRIAELKEKFETENAKAQNEWLRQQNLLQSKTIQQQQWISIFIALLVTVLLSALLNYYYYSRNLRKKNLRLEDQNHKISRQRFELEQAHAQINSLNQQLEAKIEKRTEELAEQNHRLSAYAFFNAHKLRGPLARLMGLVSLWKEASNENEKQELASYIDQTTQEFDRVVNEIAIILHQDFNQEVDFSGIKNQNNDQQAS